MIVIPPLEITDGRLTSSTVPEPDTGETAWNSGTTYALGDRRYLASTHRIYESLQAGNLNHDPTLDTQGDPDNPPVWWLDVGPTNQHAMFDLLRNTQTEAASPLVVVLTPGTRVDALGLVGLEAETVVVAMTVDAVEVYSHTEDLNTRDVFDFYSYFFEPFSAKKSMVLFDLPPYTTGVITITISSSSGTVKCGGCVVGLQSYIGAIEYDAEDDVLNFSRVDRAFDGTAQLLQRRSIPKTIQRVWADKSRVNKIRALREDLNAVPALWCGLDDDTHGYFEALLILGIYKRFTINLSHPDQALIGLELEEI
jgi:hypothetical protein